MKEQYVGDINDYRKYALLRALAGDGKIRIGVCWMLTPPDGSTDGNKTAYLDHPQNWRRFDPQLFDLLRSVSKVGGHERLIHLERSEVIPHADYFNDMVPDAMITREDYFASALDSLKNVDLIFFDPDNGLDVPSKPKGRKDSSKFVYRDEVGLAFSRGHSILIYQHFPREDRTTFVERIGLDLSVVTGAPFVWDFRTADVVFFLLIHSHHADILRERASAAASLWGPSFISGNPLQAEVPVTN